LRKKVYGNFRIFCAQLQQLIAQNKLAEIFAFFACKKNAKNNFAQKSLRKFSHFLRATATINCAKKTFRNFRIFRVQRNSFSQTMPNFRDTISPFRWKP